MGTEPKRPKPVSRKGLSLTLDHWLVIGPIVLALVIAGGLVLLS